MSIRKAKVGALMSTGKDVFHLVGFEDHGTNFGHLSRNLRVEMAYQLLILTDLEITHRVGYSETSHLGRTYRH